MRKEIKKNKKTGIHASYYGGKAVKQIATRESEYGVGYSLVWNRLQYIQRQIANLHADVLKLTEEPRPSLIKRAINFFAIKNPSTTDQVEEG